MNPVARQCALNTIAEAIDYHDAVLYSARRSRRDESKTNPAAWASWSDFIACQEATIAALQAAYRHAEEAK